MLQYDFPRHPFAGYPGDIYTHAVEGRSLHPLSVPCWCFVPLLPFFALFFTQLFLPRVAIGCYQIDIIAFSLLV